MAYLNNLLVAFSQLLNAILGGNPNELLSARVYRKNVEWAIFVLNSIFFDNDHCRKSFEFELKNEQLPEYAAIKDSV
jgi:hypothetical protein